jgi:hypothetical protein
MKTLFLLNPKASKSARRLLGRVESRSAQAIGGVIYFVTRGVPCFNIGQHGPVAQRLEQGTHNPLVPGSNPGGPKFHFRFPICDLRSSASCNESLASV